MDCALWSSLEGKIFVVLGGGIEQDSEPSRGTISRTGYFNIIGCASPSVDSRLSYQAPSLSKIACGLMFPLALNVSSDCL